jgi:hypothetical protein
MNLSVSLGLTFSTFAIILIVTNGGLLQNSFGSSIEESEIGEAAEMFEMQMKMNKFSQLSETSDAVQSAANQAIANIARGIK